MTIAFSNLGNLGHVGNQMFQYAALRGIAKNRGYDWVIPPKYMFGTRYPMKSSLYEIFNMNSVGVIQTIIPDNLTVLEERQYHFDQELFESCPDNVDISGYFQSYKYFDHIRDELLEDFSFKNTEYQYNWFKDYIAIHVRRGDYVGQPNFHPVCDTEYYAKAKEYFPGEKFIVLSDDWKWCSEQEVFADCETLSDGTPAFDLQVMTEAKGNIIANSSFSWWGAYLNQKNPTVICPERWFGNNYSHYNMEDLRPKEWIQI